MSTDWAQIKSATLDELIEVTSAMLEDYGQGKFSDSEKYLKQRAELIRNLEECETQLEGELHPKSEDWLLQLQRISHLDRQIDDMFENAKSLIERLRSESGDNSPIANIGDKDLNSKLVDFAIARKIRDS